MKIHIQSYKNANKSNQNTKSMRWVFLGIKVHCCDVYVVIFLPNHCPLSKPLKTFRKLLVFWSFQGAYIGYLSVFSIDFELIFAYEIRSTRMKFFINEIFNSILFKLTVLALKAAPATLSVWLRKLVIPDPGTYCATFRLMLPLFSPTKKNKTNDTVTSKWVKKSKNHTSFQTSGAYLSKNP